MSGSARKIALGWTAGIALATMAIAWIWIASHQTESAQATPGPSIGIDVATAGNTATTLGSIDTCIDVDQYEIFDVDIYVSEVADLMSWGAYLSFDEDVLQVTKPGDNSQNNNLRFMFQLAPPGGSIYNTSETLPDGSPGLYHIGAADTSVIQGGGDSGTGVLLRLQFYAKNNGDTQLSIAPIDRDGNTVLDSGSIDVGPWLKDSYGNLINDTSPANGFFDGPITSAGISVGGAGGTDSDGDTITDACDPDDDNDTVPDVDDNCHFVANGPNEAGIPGVGNQDNTDGDAEGDACDTDDDNDTVLDVDDNCQFVDNGPNEAGIPGVGNQDNNDGDSDGDACDDDDDNDTVLDVDDNCQYVANGPNEVGIPGVGNQDDTNGDGVGDACDPDDDWDGFCDSCEDYLGTEFLTECGNPPGSGPDGSDSGWPADLDGDGALDGPDLNSFLFPLRGDLSFNKFGYPASEGPDTQRWDLDGDGSIGGGDLNAVNPAVLASTSYPPMLEGGAAFGQSCPVGP